MKTINTNDFDALSLKIASPERILDWSYGEIMKPETINYRTGRSERGGLFDERIFGPQKDYECYCGKYRRIRYKDIICEKCGVEVTRAIVRRERMGHITLAAPVAHIWFLRGVPSRMALLLNLSVADVERVIYFAGYIITSVNEAAKGEVIKDIESEYKAKLKTVQDDKTKDKLKELLQSAKKEIGEIVVGRVIDEASYHRYSLKYARVFEAGIGAEAVHRVFKAMDLDAEYAKAEAQFEKASSLDREKIERRMALLKSLKNANIRPEWMFLTVLPVIPPDIRPMVMLEGGRHATSDVNDLYRRVINRNNRLKKLLEINAPDVILRNEKRILQEAVDALIDNAARRQSDSALVSAAQRRALKSLSETIKSKQGLFRQNLLGKRVDYSGRSVIVVGPQLKLNQCGLPKHMALELFRPFVISKILERELAYNIRGAGKLIDEGAAEVWALLEEVIKGKHVLLNRAPTLHRLGIQAFQPILIEGNAIQLHPLVCSAFNADFDGDQMAVHVPLSSLAQDEAKERMAADKNILKPGSGDPIVSIDRLDMVLGSYWVTKIIKAQKGEDKYFTSPNQAITAHDFGLVDLRAKIKVLPTDSIKYAGFENKIFETSVGRLLFNSILPKDYPFINKEIDRKVMGSLVGELIAKYPLSQVVETLDAIKNFGFKYVTRSGITWSMSDVVVHQDKKSLVEKGRTAAEIVLGHYNDGLLSEAERYRKTIEVWQEVKMNIEKLLPETLPKDGPVYDMIFSGARGSLAQVGQMAGMKGLIVNTAGETIDFPIIPSYKEGLSPLEYFITTHGARKGLADTALNTAKAGYLTRRLVDVAQDAVVVEADCKTNQGKRLQAENILGIDISLARQIRGRVLAEDLLDEDSKKIFSKGHLISKEDANKIEAAGVKNVLVRSPLTCKTIHGVCQQCYGFDLGRGRLVDLGEAVGIVAAQAIGEPGTQLTMRTFHAGGVAGVDITQGLPRVEEIFERRMPKNPAVVSHAKGMVVEVGKNQDGENMIVILSEEDEGGKGKNEKSLEYVLPPHRLPVVKKGDQVSRGELLTDGSADISEVFKYGGKEAAEEYIIREINKVYELQGASISRKHLEVILRQMFNRCRIKSSGDTRFATGDIVELISFEFENARVRAVGGTEAKGEMLILGITEAALTTDSWLSSASFQHTTRVLINNAVKGGIDFLRGLKENVIIGRLIPAGTGFRESSFRANKAIKKSSKQNLN